ncbi:MAG: phage tail assembly chaperone [Pseudomonadota bacterium]
MGGDFTQAATRLAGLSGGLLGWRPGEFWNATPAELATILSVLAPDAAHSADGDLITQLKEQFPDG